jgi:uncharacterized protein YegL
MPNTEPNIGTGIKVAKRVLTIFFLLDHSGSMEVDGRISKLNNAIPVTVEALKGLLDDNPNLSIKIKVIKFSTKADFHVGGSAGTDIENFQWYPLETDRLTATAEAINLLCDQLDFEKMPRRGYPPVCVLVSDGYSTDPESEYTKAIDRLNKEPWGKKAARIVVSIGDDIDEESLRRFVNDRGSYINCENAEQIIDYIKLKTTEASISSSESKPKESNQDNVDDSNQNNGENTGEGTIADADPYAAW